MFLFGRLRLQFTPRGVDMAKLQCDQWRRLLQVNNHKLDALGISRERVNAVRCQRGLQNRLLNQTDMVCTSSLQPRRGALAVSYPLRHNRARLVPSPFIQPHTRLRLRVPERLGQKTCGVELRLYSTACQPGQAQLSWEQCVRRAQLVILCVRNLHFKSVVRWQVCKSHKTERSRIRFLRVLHRWPRRTHVWLLVLDGPSWLPLSAGRDKHVTYGPLG